MRIRSVLAVLIGGAAGGPVDERARTLGIGDIRVHSRTIVSAEAPMTDQVSDLHARVEKFLHDTFADSSQEAKTRILLRSLLAEVKELRAELTLTDDKMCQYAERAEAAEAELTRLREALAKAALLAPPTGEKEK